MVPGNKHVVIVGSGPVGSSYARQLIEGDPDVTVLMVELGPKITAQTGLNVRNIADPDERARARRASQGPQAGPDLTGQLGIPSFAVTEGIVTARHGTHLVDFGGPGSGHSASFPAGAMSTCVGGQGVHWTCATPAPQFSERISLIEDEEWTGLVAEAERLLHVTHGAFEGSRIATAIRRILDDAFADVLPEGHRPSVLPVAGEEFPDGTVRWSGTDVVLGPLLDADDPRSARFELRDLTLARRLIHNNGKVSGVVLEDANAAEQYDYDADVVVVAADALRTPQLLWSSGIRPAALGHYLTEHPLVFSVIGLGDDVMARYASEDDLQVENARRALNPADPVSGVNRIPYSEPNHPYAGQVMYTDTLPFPVKEGQDYPGQHWGFVTAGYGLRKFPRYEDAVTFDDDEPDYRGFPAMTIEYALTDAELSQVDAAKEHLGRAAAALGGFVPGGEPRLMPNGTSLHYSGTVRLGAEDDGTSVCDPYSRVWGFDNLYLAGNGLIPTATSVNPTLTSVAIAVRGARKLLAETLPQHAAASDAA